MADREDPKTDNTYKHTVYTLCYAYAGSPAVIIGFSVEVRVLYRECESNAFTMGPLTNSI